MGFGYGPVVVAAGALDPDDAARARDRDPGPADDRVPRPPARARRRRCGCASCRSTRILDEVVSGRAEAGLLIHEGQLTYAARGSRTRCSTSASGGRRRPACRCRSASTSPGATSASGSPTSPTVLSEAIRVGLDHRDEALAYAQRFGRGIDAETTDRFVAMYVNELTCDYGEIGRRAVDELLRRSGTGCHRRVRLRRGDRRHVRVLAGRSSPPARSRRPATRRSASARRARARRCASRYGLTPDRGRACSSPRRSLGSIATLYPWGHRGRPVRRAGRDRQPGLGVAAGCLAGAAFVSSFGALVVLLFLAGGARRERQLVDRARRDALVRRAAARASRSVCGRRRCRSPASGSRSSCRRSSTGDDPRPALLAVAGGCPPGRSSGSLVLRERPARRGRESAPPVPAPMRDRAIWLLVGGSALAARARRCASSASSSSSCTASAGSRPRRPPPCSRS